MKKLALLLLTLLSVSAFAQTEDDSAINKVGDKAPAFVCTTITGKTIDISKLSGKVIMINFFATWCGPCNQELPVLQKEVWEKYKDNKNFVLVVLGREHSEEELKEFASTKGLTLPFAPDKGRKIYGLYAKKTIPRNVIIGKDGNIAYQNNGYTPEDFKKLTDFLEKQLK